MPTGVHLAAIFKIRKIFEFRLSVRSAQTEFLFREDKKIKNEKISRQISLITKIRREWFIS